MKCYTFIAGHAAPHSVALSYRVLGVSRSSYDDWRRCSPSPRAQADARLKEHSRAIYQTSRGTYGNPRIQAELRAVGERAPTGCPAHARGGVARLPRPAPPRPDDKARPAGDACPQPIQRAFSPRAIGAPDRLWVADISYVATGEGWLSLAVVLDAFSRRVVGWAMADHLRTELVLDALAMALHHRQTAPELIHHSDHGCQYTSLAFRQKLQEHGVLPSMGTVGDCFDNAVADSFFATLKVALLHRQVWPTRAIARLAIFEFIEVWGNRQRRHATLGYATPTEYEALAQEVLVA